MATHQINLKLPVNLLKAARSYAENFGFRNIQELATESIREKIFEKNTFDETFEKKEIELIDNLIGISIRKNLLTNEEELNKILLK